MRSKKQIEERLNLITKKDWYVKEPAKISGESRRYWEGYRNALLFAIQATEKPKLPWE